MLRGLERPRPVHQSFLYKSYILAFSPSQLIQTDHGVSTSALSWMFCCSPMRKRRIVIMTTVEIWWRDWVRMNDGPHQALCCSSQSSMSSLLFKRSRLQLWRRWGWLNKKYFSFFKQTLFVKEVYREDKIKEWDPVDPSELEHFLQIIIDQGREHSKS